MENTMARVEKKAKLIYWGVTGLFLFAQVSAGFMDLIRVKSMTDVILHLGYPLYFATILGLAKLLGAIAILYGRNKTLKEWAYAGFTFDAMSAAASYLFSGDSFQALPPLVILGMVLVSYRQWKRDWI